MFSIEKDKTNELKRRNELFCEVMENRFEKILKYEKDNSEQSKKRIRQYAQDGIDFVKRFKRQQTQPPSEQQPRRKQVKI